MKNLLTVLKRYSVYFLLFVILMLTGIIIIFVVEKNQISTTPVFPTATSTQDFVATIQITFETTATVTQDITPAESKEPDPKPSPNGLLLMSLFNGSYYTIFTYHPQDMNFMQLYQAEWDELEPALSPDGSMLAYRSNQTGFWDIYIRDLETGEVTNISNSQQYDGAPSWAPDDQWLVYETYHQDNFDLRIQSVADLGSQPIELTSDPADDHSPSWSPLGREIAFISNRSGNNDIWIARFDYFEDERFINLTNSPDLVEREPSYSKSGIDLLYTLNLDDSQQIIIYDTTKNTSRRIGGGSSAYWKYDDSAVISLIPLANSYALTVYSAISTKQVEILFDIPSKLQGAQWISPNLADSLLTSISYSAFQYEMSHLPSATAAVDGGRENIVKMDSVAAPYPYIASSAFQPFIDLRGRIGYLTGWDYLANLESAYTPITAPPDLGLPQNWSYTGRAIALNTLPIQADWMVLQRENINGLIFWRIWIKALKQNGSSGLPLKDPIWDLDERFSGNTVAYENGGVRRAPPEGYWVDITELAVQNGWLRLPALSSWRTYYSAARFNILVYQSVDDWMQAMLRIYPPEVLATYTPQPSGTPAGTIDKTPTRTPTQNPSATKRP